jgi:hypothetical protein
MKSDYEVSGISVGVERDVHPQRLSENQYDFALNATVGSEQGDSAIIQNEPSNMLCSRLEGAVVCGYAVDPAESEWTYFWLSFADGTSGIYRLWSNGVIPEESDEDKTCGCSFGKVLSEALEESSERYTEMCERMEEIITDCQGEEMLGFDVRTPIYNIIFKREKCGSRVYWAQRGKPARYLDFAKAADKDSEYYWDRKPLCGETEGGRKMCLNVDRLRVFPLLDIPCISVEATTYGGTLRSGTYEFLVAYCDAAGNEMSSYYSLTNPVPVFSENDVVVEGNDWGKQTSMGIRVRINGLDEQASYYKLAVIQCADVNNQTVYFFEGVHATTDRDVALTSSALTGAYNEGDTVRMYEMTTLQILMSEKPVYKTTEGLAMSGKMLFQYGLTEEPEWNLQPIANLMGALVRWQTHVAGEDLYKDGAACSKFGGYMRDEVYALGIRFLCSDGYRTSVFPLIGRPALPEDVQMYVDENGNVVNGGKDVESVVAFAPNCSEVARRWKWQYENTAEALGVIDGEGGGHGACADETNCNNIVQATETKACSMPYVTLENVDGEWLRVDVSDGNYVEDVAEWLTEHISSLCSSTNRNPVDFGDDEAGGTDAGTDDTDNDSGSGSGSGGSSGGGGEKDTKEGTVETRTMAGEKDPQDDTPTGGNSSTEDPSVPNTDASSGDGNYSSPFNSALAAEICKIMGGQIEVDGACSPSALFPCCSNITEIKDRQRVIITGFEGLETRLEYYDEKEDYIKENWLIDNKPENGLMPKIINTQAFFFSGLNFNSMMGYCSQCESYDADKIAGFIGKRTELVYDDYPTFNMSHSGDSMDSAIEVGIMKHTSDDFDSWTVMKRHYIKGQTYCNGAARVVSITNASKATGHNDDWLDGHDDWLTNIAMGVMSRVEYNRDTPSVTDVLLLSQTMEAYGLLTVFSGNKNITKEELASWLLLPGYGWFATLSQWVTDLFSKKDARLNPDNKPWSDIGIPDYSDDACIMGTGDDGLLLERTPYSKQYYYVGGKSTFEDTRNNFINVWNWALEGGSAPLMRNALFCQNQWFKTDMEYPKTTGAANKCSNTFHDGAIHRWSSYLHKGTRWFKIKKPKIWDGTADPDEVPEFLMLQIVKPIKMEPPKVIEKYYDHADTHVSKTGIDITTASILRVTFWKKSGTLHTNPFLEGWGTTTDPSYFVDGANRKDLDTISAPQKERYLQGIGTEICKITPDWFGSEDEIYVAVDSPIAMCGWIFNGFYDNCGRNILFGSTMCTTIPEGAFGLALLEPQPTAVSLTFEKAMFEKESWFAASCPFCADGMQCEGKPYEYGRMGYWESEVEYPRNHELFNCEKAIKGYTTAAKIAAKLKSSGISEEDYEEFEELYVHNSNSEGKSINFCGKPIRHFKMPDNRTAQFMMSGALPFGDSVIYPLGVYLKNSTVDAFLDLAVAGELISEEQRKKITGYEIVRGDRALDRSVVAAGLGYDMYKYRDTNKNDVWFSNFPYNDLSDNEQLLDSFKNGKAIKHPYDGKGNTKFTFHSPDTSFEKPTLPYEVKVEGFETGASVGRYVAVRNHPKWVILSSKGETVVRVVALAEAANDIAMSVASGGLSIWSMIISGIASAIQEGLELPQSIYSWQQTLINFGTPFNFAYYYSSEGRYNVFQPNDYAGNISRGLALSKYLRAGRYMSRERNTGDVVRINAVNRESSVVMSFGEDYRLDYSFSINTIDTSRVKDVCAGESTDDNQHIYVSPELNSNICSPYMKLKQYVPTQYGDIYSIRWVATGACVLLGAVADDVFVFGGDTSISRFAIKRKFPFFYQTAMGVADMTAFGYRDYANVGYPKYYVDYDTCETDQYNTQGGSFFQEKFVNQGWKARRSQAVLECDSETGTLYRKGKFYLYSYGIASFLVESEINCNFRLAGKSLGQDFYPHQSDYTEWTQESVVPIHTDNYYKYNPVYSRTRTHAGYRMLPSTYERAFWDCKAVMPNGIIWSVPDNNENALTDPWLTYKPMDVYEFPTSLGRLIDVRGIESMQLLARFEHSVQLYGAIDVLKDRLDGDKALIGGSVFQQRQMEYNTTDLGYAGTQSRDMVSCEFGHFWVDVKRGQVFSAQPNGAGLKEITPGLFNWFKEQLPMKLLRYGILNKTDGEGVLLTETDVDNKFMGMGVSMGWDARFKRVFLTKRDYVPKVAAAGYTGAGAKDLSQYGFRDGQFEYGGKVISLQDSEYFEDVSWTVAFSCLTKRWISYYSFTPDYYVGHQHYFQTGRNTGLTEKRGLWSHLLTNRSFQVFYGDRYPFIVQAPLKDTIVNRMLCYVEYWMECRRYQDEWDYAVHQRAGFNKAWIYNATNNSGELRLVPRELNNTAQDIKYPRMVASGTGYAKEILTTEMYGKWRFNDFFNQTRDENNRLPIWRRDRNNIMMETDPKALQWGRTWQDRLRGEWFMLRLENDAESRYQMLFRLAGAARGGLSY